jgi:hypothetical protein
VWVWGRELWTRGARHRSLLKLCPVALTTQCSAGTAGFQYLTRLGLALACKRNATATPGKWKVAACVREVRERVGVALMCEMADQLIDAMTTKPHAALAEARVHIHTAWRPGAARSGGERGADGQPDLRSGEQLRGAEGGRLHPAGAGARGHAPRGLR